jgi:hypothetical protein
MVRHIDFTAINKHSHNNIIITAAAVNLCVVLTFNWLIIRRGRKQQLWN